MGIDICMTKSSRKNVPGAGINLGTVRSPSVMATVQATAPATNQGTTPGYDGNMTLTIYIKFSSSY